MIRFVLLYLLVSPIIARPDFNLEDVASSLRGRTPVDETAADDEHAEFLFDDATSSPLVYRYFARTNARTHSAGSFPFVLLGPNVDHWKVTGQELAARGFNVIACESSTESNRQDELLLELLDALRWSRVIVVACDREAVWAVQMAMQPHQRIVGLVLCGKMDAVEDFVEGFDQPLDQFLQQYLPCPAAVVWDGTIGDEASSATENLVDTEDDKDHRYLVIGGGTAPHRKRPKLLAWVLTRFVEEQIAPDISIRTRPQIEPPRSSLPFHMDDLLSPGSPAVFGRMVATALTYAVAVKVVIFQFENFRDGIYAVSSWRERVVRAIVGIFATIGSLFTRHPSVDTIETEPEPITVEDEANTDEDRTVPPEEDERQEEPADDESPSETDDDVPKVKPFFFLDNIIV